MIDGKAQIIPLNTTCNIYEIPNVLKVIIKSLDYKDSSCNLHLWIDRAISLS